MSCAFQSLSKEMSTLSDPVITEMQSQIALMLPVKSTADFTALEQILNSAAPEMTAAADAIGTVHFARFMHMDDSTLAFVTEFDGSFADYVAGFLQHLGPVFDQVLPHLNDAPTVPLGGNSDALITWLQKHHKGTLAFYSGYPTMTVKDIKSRAGLTGTAGGTSTVQNVLAMNFPIKSLLDYMELRFGIPRMLPTMDKAADAIGTLHFGNFVDLGLPHIAFFTIYDGDFTSYMNDFMKYLGPVFDAMMAHFSNPAPTPVAKNPEQFIAWANAIQHNPIYFYSAYPTLGVQDVRTLATTPA
jgi:hypothetical protein